RLDIGEVRATVVRFICRAARERRSAVLAGRSAGGASLALSSDTEGIRAPGWQYRRSVPRRWAARDGLAPRDMGRACPCARPQTLAKGTAERVRPRSCIVAAERQSELESASIRMRSVPEGVGRREGEARP